MTKRTHIGRVVAKQAKKSRPAQEVRTVKIVGSPSPAKDEVTAVQWAVIQALARGELLADVARRLQHQIAPHEADRKRRLIKTRSRIRRWTQAQKFRDLLWDETMVQLDLDSPKIVRGVSRKAQGGRVDAARLALEMNGRHAPQADVQPAQINIAFGNIPRPRRSITDALEIVDMDPDEVVEVEDD